MEVIKFRRPHFRIEDNSFHSFTYWGPVEGGFKSPEKISSCYSMGDQMFTGLTDKNGKEIWEGDIVSYTQSERFGECVNNYTTTVKYVDYGFAPMKYNLDCEDGFYSCIISDIEVIGNTYEHPHLLTN